MKNAYIYDTARTAFGSHGSILSSIRPDDMLAHLIQTLVQRNDFDLSFYNDIIVGNTN
jgi:acetyl-CoA C-acetyltransferase